MVNFTRSFDIASIPEDVTLHISADTRYKLYVNGQRIAVGPARGSSLIWYYDTLDIAKDLVIGRNEIKFVVVRYFPASRSAICFTRTAIPGLTVVGGFGDKSSEFVNLSTDDNWTAQIDESIKFPTGIIDDIFLHVCLRLQHSE